jgi:hypothetical protein
VVKNVKRVAPKGVLVLLGSAPGGVCTVCLGGMPPLSAHNSSEVYRSYTWKG